MVASLRTLQRHRSKPTLNDNHYVLWLQRRPFGDRVRAWPRLASGHIFKYVDAPRWLLDMTGVRQFFDRDRGVSTTRRLQGVYVGGQYPDLEQKENGEWCPRPFYIDSRKHTLPISPGRKNVSDFALIAIKVIKRIKQKPLTRRHVWNR